MPFAAKAPNAISRIARGRSDVRSMVSASRANSPGLTPRCPLFLDLALGCQDRIPEGQEIQCILYIDSPRSFGHFSVAGGALE